MGRFDDFETNQQKQNKASAYLVLSLFGMITAGVIVGLVGMAFNEIGGKFTP